MSLQQKTLLKKWLDGAHDSPALRHIHGMVSSSSVEVSHHTAIQPAQEVISLWSVRLWNSVLRGRRFVGLADLVRELRELSSEDRIEQFSLNAGKKTALLFFEAQTHRPVGAVISVRDGSDVKRSLRNLQEAKGLQVPALSVATRDSSKDKRHKKELAVQVATLSR